MPLSLSQVYDVCQATDPDGKCCRYLSQDGHGTDYHCLKKSQFKKEIDEETEALVEKGLKITYSLIKKAQLAGRQEIYDYLKSNMPKRAK